MISGLGGRRCTVAADKGYDSREFVAQLRAMRATPHVAQFGTTGHRGSAIEDARHGTPAIGSVNRSASSWSKASAG